MVPISLPNLAPNIASASFYSQQPLMQPIMLSSYHGSLSPLPIQTGSIDVAAYGSYSSNFNRVTMSPGQL